MVLLMIILNFVSKLHKEWAGYKLSASGNQFKHGNLNDLNKSFLRLLGNSEHNPCQGYQLSMGIGNCTLHLARFPLKTKKHRT